MKKLHPRCAAFWQAPASWERKNYSIICKSIHQNYSSLQKAQYKRTLSFTTLNYGQHISWGFPNLLFLEVLNLFWGVQLFVLLRFVWNSLPSFIPNDLFLSLLFSALPFHPSLMSNLNDLKGKYQSPRTYRHHQDWSHMVSTKMTGEAPALVYSTGMMWEHNSFCSSLPIPETSSAC